MSHRSVELEPGNQIEEEIPADASGKRLDRYLSERFPEVTRNRFQRWIKEGYVTLRDRAENTTQGLKASTPLAAGQILMIAVPQPTGTTIRPQALEFRILHEDDSLIVIHKPPGIAVHPGPEDASITVASGLVHRWQDLPGHKARPGIVHRLDKATEGILVVARTESALSELSRQFKERTVQKEYFAWLSGAPLQSSATIARPIARKRGGDMRMCVRPDGRMAITHYQAVTAVASRSGRKFCSVAVQLETGRTHQIRVHFADLGCPVIGDPLYSRSFRKYEKFGLLLLARKLAFRHPVSHEWLSFEIDLPERFRSFAAQAEIL